MAREYQIQQRQFSEQRLTLPSTSAQGRFAELMNQAANKIGQKVVENNVQAAALRGAEDVISGKKPQKLAPGINAATNAYNNAVIKTEQSVNYATFVQMSNQAAYDVTKPGALNANSPEQYNAKAKSLMEGILGGTLPQNRDALAFQMYQTSANTALKIQGKADEKVFKQNKEMSSFALTAIEGQMSDALFNGNLEQASQYKKQYLEDLNYSEKAGYISLAEKKASEHLLELKEIESLYSGMAAKISNLAPGEIEGALYKLATEVPENLTQEEYQLAIKSFSAEAAKHKRLKESFQTVTVAQLENAINRNEITSESDLANYQDQISALQYENVLNKLYRKQNQELSKNAKVGVALERIKLGAGLQNLKMSDDIVEAAFSQVKESYLAQKKDQNKNQNEFLTIEDEAEILKQFNRPVPSINERIKYSLNSANSESELSNIEWSLGLLRSVAKDKPNTVNLTAEERAIANTANAAIVYSATPAKEAIEAARAKINVDPVTLEARRLRYQQSLGSQQKNIKSSYESMFGGNWQNDPHAFGTFTTLYEAFSLLNDSNEVTLESVKQVMSPVFGKSRYIPKDSVGYMPLEKVVPFSNDGSWLNNQLKLKMYDIAQSHKNAPAGEISIDEKIRWDGVAPPESINSETLYRLPIATKKMDKYALNSPAEESEIYIKIKGESRKVYYQSDGTARQGDNEKVKVYPYTLNPITNKPEMIIDPNSPTGYATIYIDGLDEFIPSVYDRLKDEPMTDAVNETAIEMFKKENKIPIVRAFNFKKYFKEAAPIIRKDIEKSQGDMSKIKKRLSSETAPKKNKIDIWGALGEVSDE